jgi:gliding motility-associated-like protein
MVKAQPSNNSSPYCQGTYGSGQCNQPGPSNSAGNFVNDFIDCVQTAGANTNINNCGSGCNTLPNNYAFYCSHYLQVNAGQTISMTVQSGITFAQGFAVWIDWDQNGTFNTNEYMAGSNTVPSAATPTTLVFTIPSGTPPGSYRMRVRCAFATTGPNITPCGSHGFGETEDYMIFVGQSPSGSAIATVTAAIANATICEGATASFSATPNATSGITFLWQGPNSFTSTQQYPTIANTTPSATGIYTVTANNGSCPGSHTVALRVVGYPQFTMSVPAATICQGGSIFTGVTFTGGVTVPSAFLYSWTPGFNSGVANPAAATTSISPLLLPTSQTLGINVYTIIVTPTAWACPNYTTVTITINNPLTPTLVLPGAVCNTSAQQMLVAVPGGGTWAANQAVTPQGMFNPAAAVNYTSSVTYSVSAGNCVVSNSGILQVAKFNTAALSGSLNMLCSLDGPVNLMALVTNTFSGQWTGQFVNTNSFSPTGIPSNTYTLKYKATSTPSNNFNSSFYNYATVCPDSSFLNVVVFNPPTPTIVPIVPMCTNARTVELKATPLGGTWSQNSGVTSGGIQTPSLCSVFPNTNTVVYTAGIGTCIASSSATFVVAQFIPATLTGTIPNQCVSGNPINLMSIVSNTTGTWSGIGIPSPNVFSPANLPTGTYKLKYSTGPLQPLTSLCPDSSILYVKVLNPQMPTITQVGPFCTKSNTVQLQVNPTTGYWNISQYLNSFGVFTPSLASVGLNRVEYVVGTPSCNVKNHIDISVEAFEPATILNQVPDLCTTSSPFNLQPITQSNFGQWSGPGLTGSILNPLATGAGTFTYLHSTASSPSGLCPDQATLSVRVYSLETPTITQPKDYCNNAQPFKLIVSPLGGYFSGANNGAVNVAGLFNPATAIIGGNIVSYSIAAGPCIAFAQTTINVLKFVSAAMSKTIETMCQNDPEIDLNSFVTNLHGTWQPAPGLLGSMFNPAKGLLGPNTFTYHTSPPENALLCPDVSTLHFRVIEIPTVSIKANNFRGCAPLEVSLNISETNVGTAVWFTGDEQPSPTGLLISHLYNTPGTYSVEVEYRKDGCRTQAKLDTFITVFEQPTANFIFEKDEVTTAAPDVLLINQSYPLGNNRYEWSVQGQPVKFYEINPTLTLKTIGNYKVTLKAVNSNGCTSSITKNIVLRNEFECYIPNVFTPNDDGLNDVFKPVFSPYGLDEYSYYLEIFDRWGNMVFRTTDPAKGWDGKVKKIDDGKQDVYSYRVRYKDLEGRVYVRDGKVTLLDKDAE